MTSWVTAAFRKRAYERLLDEVLSPVDAYDRVVLWRSSFGWQVPLFQRPQHIALALSKRRTLYLYEVSKITDKISGARVIAPNLCLVDLHNRVFERLLTQRLSQLDRPKYLHYYSTEYGLSLDAVEAYRAAGFTVLYEYIDDISPEITMGDTLPKHVVDKYEDAMQRPQNALVVVTADALEADVLARRGADNMVYAANGVDLGHFQSPPEIALGKDMQALLAEGKPIVGYYGAIAKWFDYELLRETASLCPDVNFVLIGVMYDETRGLAMLRQQQNIHYLGAVPYDALPAYASRFAVCMIPFVLNEITQATSPLKLFEYMALEKPVITTAMHECMKYQSVMIAQDAASFAMLARKAIAMTPETDAAYFDTLRREARDNAWDSKAEAIVGLLKSAEKGATR